MSILKIVQMVRRIIEQRLINAYGMSKNGGQLINEINSIKPGNSWFNYGIVGN